MCRGRKPGGERNSPPPAPPHRAEDEAAPLAGEPDEEEIEREIELETDQVIQGEINNTSGDEAQRATLLYLSLYEVLHAEARVLQLPDDTLYTGFIVLPMIARNSGYTLSLTSIAVKLVLLTILCVMLQSGLILSMHHARVVLPALDGVPSMCTYGQDVGTERVPFGPTGQVFEKTYGNVETDYTMVMIRNTLAQIMDKVGVKNPSVGPVEYGMESTTCRVVCAAVFCVAICGEIFSMETMARFLVSAPTSPRQPTNDNDVDPEESLRWVEFVDAARDPKAKEIWPIIGKSSLDHVRFKCGGMTMCWKICSWLMLACRGLVVVLTFWNGLSFLMNTGGIVDSILNSLALMFIIDLDRLMFYTLSRGLAKEILHRLEPLHVRPQRGELDHELRKRRSNEISWGCMAFVKKFFMNNIITMVLCLVTIGGHYAYFLKHCEMDHPPLDVTQWFSPSYFLGQTRFFGGWEFIFGSWYSQPTVDKYSHNITCHPAYHATDSDTHTHAKGCGMPTPWTGR